MIRRNLFFLIYDRFFSSGYICKLFNIFSNKVIIQNNKRLMYLWK